MSKENLLYICVPKFDTSATGINLSSLNVTFKARESAYNAVCIVFHYMLCQNL
jgi:hypothetical protein